MIFEQLTLSVFLAAALASVVNGALGYGFSSITVPVALAFHSNRLINPAFALLEVLLNGASVWLNRKALRAVWRRTVFIILGMLPGVVVGSLLLGVLSVTLIKAGTYALLLPLVLAQLAGLNRPISTKSSVPFGFGLGVLYSLTTISGPPLALFFNNQNLTQDEFRAALGVVRLAQSVCTCVVYAALGYFTPESASFALWLVPALLLGLPFGRFAVSRLPTSRFRAVCMTADAVIISFGLALALQQLGWIPAEVSRPALSAVVGFLGGISWQRAKGVWQ
jgi:uncharacterized protein